MFAALVSREALAQDPGAVPAVADNAPEAAAKGKTDAVNKGESGKRPPGWTPGIAFGGTFNLVDTRSVVGTQDGTALMLGAALDASLEFNEGMHEWRNALKAGAGVTRTPSLDEFVKTNDGLSFETIYLLHVVEIFGPYARFAYNTSMFPGMDIRPAPVNYVVSNLDGSTTEYLGRRLEMTDPFKPSTFKEGIGVFVQPLNTERIKLEARAGVGAQESLAAGNLAINDDSTTPQIEIKEMDDVWQIGGEAIANAWGFIDETKRVSYTVGLGVLIPFAASELPAGDDRSLPELTNVEGIVGLNVKLFDWASLGYKLTVVREPMLVDTWQVSNNLLLTIGAAFGSKAPVPPAPPPCDCAKDCKVAPAAAEGDAAPTPPPPAPPGAKAPASPPPPAPPPSEKPAEPAPAPPPNP
ncbi:MAG: hypothetical protein JNK04_02210 [Myxococcales bacterium]|nr:hypothetical protein [Myxococcales bacterium]